MCQTQEKPDKGVMEVMVKISGLEGTTKGLPEMFRKLTPLAEKYGVSVQKRNRFRMGKYITLAKLHPPFDNYDEAFDLEGFIQTMQTLEKALMEFRKLLHIAGRD